jgi:hypothetical protein
VPRLVPADLFLRNITGTSTTIPSAVVVALFAWLATKAVAKHGFADTHPS